MPSRGQIINALTIDVEEHFQVHAFKSVIKREAWEHYPSRVAANTRRVLQLLRHYNVHATFFVLGWVADRFPQLIQEIASDGHEVATHGYWHELVYYQTPQEFTADLCDSLAAIGRALDGTTLLGYRAPAFSITDDSLWALSILHEHGLRYDSSVFPLAPLPQPRTQNHSMGFQTGRRGSDRKGLRAGATVTSRFASKTEYGLWEFPMSTLCVAGQNLPVAGGGYFRLFPLAVTRYAIRRLNAEQQPAVIYLHPWEFDPAQPRIPGASTVSRFRHYVNLAHTESRLEALLQEFRFAPIREAFETHLEQV